MMGGEHSPRRVRARLGETMKRRKAERMSFRPAVLRSDGTVVPAPYCGSAHIHAYVEANAMVAFPLGVRVMEEGTDIDVVVLE
jgi:molybdopterin molybdotransferase